MVRKQSYPLRHVVRVKEAIREKSPLGVRQVLHDIDANDFLFRRFRRGMVNMKKKYVSRGGEKIGSSICLCRFAQVGADIQDEFVA